MTLYAYEIPQVKTTTSITPPYDAYFEKYGAFADKGLKAWKPYKGEFVAPPTKAETDAINLLYSQAPGYRNLGAGTLDLAKRTIAGDFIDISKNSWAQPAFDAAVRPIENQLFRKVLPEIDSASYARGSYSGIRPQLAKVAATQAAAQTAGDITSKMALDIYGKERQFQLTAPSMLREGVGLQTMEPLTLAQAGGAERGFNQSALQNEILKWDAEHMGQINAAAALAPAYAALPKPTTTSGPYGGGGGGLMGGGGGGADGNQWGGAITGAMGGAAMGASAAAAAGFGVGTTMMAAGTALAWNPVGWGLLLGGAILGGAAGYFGS